MEMVLFVLLCDVSADKWYGFTLCSINVSLESGHKW